MVSMSSRKTEKKLQEEMKIFIPWGKDDDTEGKIYHYNGDGGESTWSLPNSWKDASQVTVYKLSENGKSDKQTVSVTDGKVTLKADAKTGYVLYKEEAKKIETSDTMEWSTGSPVKDMGFDSYKFLMSGSNLLRQKVWNILRLKIIRLEMRIFTLKGKKMGKWSRF